MIILNLDSIHVSPTKLLYCVIPNNTLNTNHMVLSHLAFHAWKAGPWKSGNKWHNKNEMLSHGVIMVTINQSISQSMSQWKGNMKCREGKGLNSCRFFSGKVCFKTICLQTWNISTCSQIWIMIFVEIQLKVFYTPIGFCEFLHDILKVLIEKCTVRTGVK